MDDLLQSFHPYRVTRLLNLMALPFGDYRFVAATKQTTKLPCKGNPIADSNGHPINLSVALTAHDFSSVFSTKLLPRMH
jgi:hypothetical protein